MLLLMFFLSFDLLLYSIMWTVLSEINLMMKIHDDEDLIFVDFIIFILGVFCDCKYDYDL